MDYEHIGDEFCKKFYKWRLLDAEREISENFPFLGKMKNPYMQRVLASLLTFSPQEQLRIVHTLIKMSLKPQLLIELGDSITINDAELLKKFYIGENKAVRENPEISKLFDLKFEKSNFKEFKTKDLKTILLNQLNKAFNASPKFRDSSSIRYEQDYDQWTISTSADCERGCYYYNQQVYTYDDQKRIVLGGQYNISLNGWLGFRNHSTWCFLSENDPSNTASMIAGLCVRFISILPELLN
jgi:hypothetical protein